MKIFSILLIAVSTFILNIGLYYTSENYRSFLKNIKQDSVIKEVNDEYIIENNEKEGDLESELNNTIEKIKVKNKSVEEKILSDYSNKFLNKFINYNLVELKSHSNLMDVTSEYPDDYFEYYNRNLTLYFFPTKNYNEVKEIFEIESDGKFFKINEVDNFGDESFYINLGEEFDDNFIRIIFTQNSNVIGIKISKSEYNNIKNLIK